MSQKNFRKSDMSIEAVTDAIHEYMYETLNESTETEEEKKFRHVDKRKLKNTKTIGIQKQDEWTTINAEHPTDQTT